MSKSGELIIYAQAMTEIDPGPEQVIDAVIDKYGMEAYMQLLVDMGQNVFVGLLSGELDLDDDGNEVDMDWEDVDDDDDIYGDNV